MKPLILAAAFALVSAPVLAQDLTMDTRLGSTQEEITETLKSMGYDVRKVEVEDGKIEAYVVKGSKMAEIYVDPASGLVSKIETK